MSYLVAVDPGMNGCGIAGFVDGDLVFADVIVSKASRKLTERAFDVPMQLLLLLQAGFPNVFQLPKLTKLVFEYPRIVKHGQAAKADPDDILALVLVLGGFGALMIERGFQIPGMARPADWKGQVKKWVMTNRILACLTPAERALLGKKPNHNTVDAVGLGLDELRRLPMAGEVLGG